MSCRIYLVSIVLYMDTLHANGCNIMLDLRNRSRNFYKALDAISKLTEYEKEQIKGIMNCVLHKPKEEINYDRLINRDGHTSTGKSNRKG